MRPATTNVELYITVAMEREAYYRVLDVTTGYVALLLLLLRCCRYLRQGPHDGGDADGHFVIRRLFSSSEVEHVVQERCLVSIDAERRTVALSGSLRYEVLCCRTRNVVVHQNMSKQSMVVWVCDFRV